MSCKIRISNKGSTSSGNYGHVGRPGKIGGSGPYLTFAGNALPSGVMVATTQWVMDNVNIPEWDKGNDAYRNIAGAIEASEIPASHLDGLTMRLNNNVGTGAERSYGQYNDKTMEMWIDRDVADLSGSDKALLNSVTCHEVGHHVSDILKPRLVYVAQRAFDHLAEITRSKLYNAGLRQHSLKNSEEFIADLYKIWRFGTQDKLQAAKRIVRASLDDLFLG
jgi:hypothetical protein